MLVLNGLMPLFAIRELILHLDIYGLALLGVQWVNVLYGLFSFEKRVVRVISTQDASVSGRKEIYMVVFLVRICQTRDNGGYCNNSIFCGVDGFFNVHGFKQFGDHVLTHLRQIWLLHFAGNVYK